MDVLAAVLADLAPCGHLRVAINYGNPVLAHPDPSTGAPQGVSADLATALGGRGAAYDLFLTRSLMNAELVRAETSAGALDLFARSDLSAAAGVRQSLLSYASTHPGYRVIDGRFAAMVQAMGTPRGRDAGLAFLREFVEDAKRSGFVAALERHDQRDAAVAPPGRCGLIAGALTMDLPTHQPC